MHIANREDLKRIFIAKIYTLLILIPYLGDSQDNCFDALM